MPCSPHPLAAKPQGEPHRSRGDRSPVAGIHVRDTPRGPQAVRSQGAAACTMGAGSARFMHQSTFAPAPCHKSELSPCLCPFGALTPRPCPSHPTTAQARLAGAEKPLYKSCSFATPWTLLAGFWPPPLPRGFVVITLFSLLCFGLF